MAHSPDANPSSPHEQALKIIEQIHKIGFPSSGNIETLKTHMRELSALSAHLTPTDRIAIKQLMKAILRIKRRLEEDGDISVRMYTTLNKHLILLKSSLIHPH